MCALLESVSWRWIPHGNRELVQTSDNVRYFVQAVFEGSLHGYLGVLALCGVRRGPRYVIKAICVGIVIVATNDVAR